MCELALLLRGPELSVESGIRTNDRPKKWVGSRSQEATDPNQASHLTGRAVPAPRSLEAPPARLLVDGGVHRWDMSAGSGWRPVVRCADAAGRSRPSPTAPRLPRPVRGLPAASGRCGRPGRLAPWPVRAAREEEPGQGPLVRVGQGAEQGGQPLGRRRRGLGVPRPVQAGVQAVGRRAGNVEFFRLGRGVVVAWGARGRGFKSRRPDLRGPLSPLDGGPFLLTSIALAAGSSS